MDKLTTSECTVADTFALTSREITDQGFLAAPAILARTGVQSYTARELGIADGSPSRIIRLYRPAEEVFKPESMSSFEAKPVTLNHPKGNRVAADNWRAVAVGDVHGIHQAPDGMAGRLVVRDERAVKAVQQEGKTALSNGYTFTLDPTPGTTPEGQAYDGIQRNIRGNHVAIVDVARGGPVCRIADSKGDKDMIKLALDGIPVEVDETAAAAIRKLETKAADAVTAADSANLKLKTKIKVGDKEFLVSDSAELQKAVDAIVADRDELKKQVLTPEQKAALVQSRVALVGDAGKLVSGYKADGKTDVQVYREVLKTVGDANPSAKAISEAVLGGKTLEAADEATLATAFKAVSAAKVTTSTTTAADSAIAGALLPTAVGGSENKPSGRNAFIERQNNAWKGEKSAK